MQAYLPPYITRLGAPSLSHSRSKINHITQGHRLRHIQTSPRHRPNLRAMSTSVSTTEAASQLQSPTPPLYIDVRTPSEFATGHPPAAINLPVMNPIGVPVLSFVNNVKSHVDVDKPVLVGCKSGKRSGMAIGLLKVAGFTRLINVDGGFDDWLAKGLPVEK